MAQRDLLGAFIGAAAVYGRYPPLAASFPVLQRATPCLVSQVAAALITDGKVVIM